MYYKIYENLMAVSKGALSNAQLIDYTDTSLHYKYVDLSLHLQDNYPSWAKWPFPNTSGRIFRFTFCSFFYETYVYIDLA